MLKEIENATKKFEITQELAEKEARVNVCKRFEEEFVPLQLEENDEAITSQEQIARFLDSQPNVLNPTNHSNTTETEAIPPPSADPAPLSLNLNPSNPEFVPNNQFPPTD